MSVHVNKCSYRPVECQLCKKNVGDGAVSSNSSSSLHVSSIVTCSFITSGTPQE